MIIDLSSIIENNYIESYKKKSKIITEKLKKYNNGYILIVPINIFNILQMDDRFIDYEPDIAVAFVTGIYKVGEICGFECYVDIFIKSDEILITYDKLTMRDNKIDYLLNNNNLIEEKRVKIIS
jgi:hypothetical protein